MAFIHLPKQHNALKPQGRVEVDWGSSLSNGLVFASLENTPIPTNIVDGRIGSRASVDAFSLDGYRGEVSYLYTESDYNSRVDYTGYDLDLDSEGITIISEYVCASGQAQFERAINITPSSDSTKRISIGPRNSIEHRANFNAGSNTVIENGGGTSETVYESIAVVHKSGYQQMWVNGENKGTSSNSTGWGSYKWDTISLGSTPDASFLPFHGRIRYCYIFKGIKDANEIRRITDNPFSIVKPSNNIVYFTNSGAVGSNYSGTASSSLSISISSSAPGNKSSSGVAQASSSVSTLAAGPKGSSGKLTVGLSDSSSVPGLKNSLSTADSVLSESISTIGYKSSSSSYSDAISSSSLVVSAKGSAGPSYESISISSYVTGTATDSRLGSSISSLSVSSSVSSSIGSYSSISDTLSLDIQVSSSVSRSYFASDTLSVTGSSSGNKNSYSDIQYQMSISDEASGARFVPGEATPSVTSNTVSSMVADSPITSTVADGIISVSYTSE